MGLISDPASSEANSYVSLAEATIILGNRPYTAAWNALSTTPSALGWVADGPFSIGATTVTIKNGTGTFEVGNVISFAGHDTLYSLTGATASSVDVSPPLVANVADLEEVRRLTLNEKEQFLHWSTQTLDAQVSWTGVRREDSQPLRWPRSGVFNCDGDEYCTDCFPSDLKTLAAEFALYLATRDTSQTPPLMGLGFSRAKVDVLEVEVDSSQTVTMMPTYVQDLIGCMGTYTPTTNSGAYAVPLVRS